MLIRIIILLSILLTLCFGDNSAYAEEAVAEEATAKEAKAEPAISAPSSVPVLPVPPTASPTVPPIPPLVAPPPTVPTLPGTVPSPSPQGSSSGGVVQPQAPQMPSIPSPPGLPTLGSSSSSSGGLSSPPPPPVVPLPTKEKEVEKISLKKEVVPKKDFWKKKNKNHKTQVMSEKVYRKEYNKENNHLPKAVYKEDLNAVTFMAAHKGDLHALRALLDGGVSTEIRDANGNTPLIAAIEGGQTHAASVLVLRGARLDARNKQNESALSIAKNMERFDLVDLLKKASDWDPGDRRYPSQIGVTAYQEVGVDIKQAYRAPQEKKAKKATKKSTPKIKQEKKQKPLEGAKDDFVSKQEQKLKEIEKKIDSNVTKDKSDAKGKAESKLPQIEMPKLPPPPVLLEAPKGDLPKPEPITAPKQ